MCLDANHLRAQVGVKLTSCLNIRSEPFCQSRIVYLSLLEIHLQNTIAKVKNACVCRMQRAHSMWNLKLCANILLAARLSCDWSSQVRGRPYLQLHLNSFVLCLSPGQQRIQKSAFVKMFTLWCRPHLVANFGFFEPYSPSNVEVRTFYPFTLKVNI